MRYFVFSDCHGDYNALILELDKKGFEKHDPNHTLISLGDNFDRGLQSKEVFNYLNSLERKILIKGNHELIFKEALERGKLEYLDFRNGLGETFSSFNYFNNYENTSMRFMIDWIDNMKWYYETHSYIFTHSWLPANFRQAKGHVWESAVWKKTPDMIAIYGTDWLPSYGKTLVFGHWGTHLLHNDPNNHGIWEDRKKKLIGLDATSVISNKVNVLVVEDESI